MLLSELCVSGQISRWVKGTMKAKKENLVALDILLSPFEDYTQQSAVDFMIYIYTV